MIVQMDLVLQSKKAIFAGRKLNPQFTLRKKLIVMIR